jgi:Skp family chaperone for outer membrane proteins
MHMRSAWVLGLVLLILTSIASAALFAADPPATTLAMIDMEKVFNGYVSLKQANDEFARFAADTDRAIAQNRALRLLDDKEVQEIKDMRSASVLNADQKARLQTLENASDAREQELVAMEQKTSLSADEQARRDQLMAIAQKRGPAVAAEEKRLTQAKDEKNKTMAAPFDAAIGVAVEKVAKQNHVGAIFRRETVVWATLDLTDQVLAELNKTKPGDKK